MTPLRSSTLNPDRDPAPSKEKTRKAQSPQQGDIDPDDLDPQAPHSPPDTGPGRVIFEESAIS